MTEAVQLIALLRERGKTLVTAESCTGGFLGKLLTDVTGASAVYLGGIISYDYCVKESLLGVDPAVLREKGAVCEEVAEQMARAVRDRLNADFALATTGNAGPGSDPLNPNIGEIYIALASSKGAKVRKLQLQGNRRENRMEACRSAFQLLLEDVHG